MRRNLLLITAGLLLLAGCGQVARHQAPSPSSSPPPAQTGIVGRVLISGGPVSAEFPPTPRPYPMSKVTVTDSAGTIVATATPGSDGTFTIDLPPGDYTAEAKPTSGNPWFAPEKVTVRAGLFTKVDIYAQAP